MKALRAIVLVAFFAGCASAPLDLDARKARVPEFSFSPMVIAAGAYQVPNAKWTSDVGADITKYSGGGLIPSLVGAAVDQHILNEQQRRFDETQGSLLVALNEQARQPPSAAVERAVLDAVKANGFLGPKMRGSSENTLEVTLLRFGLAKRNKEGEEDPMLAAQMLVNLTIHRKDGALIRLGGYSGSSNDALPISALAKNPELISKLYQEAADSLGTVVSEFLKRKYEN